MTRNMKSLIISIHMSKDIILIPKVSAKAAVINGIQMIKAAGTARENSMKKAAPHILTNMNAYLTARAISFQPTTLRPVNTG